MYAMCTSILFYIFLNSILLLIQISNTTTQTKCWNQKILVWLRGSMTSSDKCWSSKRKFCLLSQHSRKCWGASTFSTAIHHAYQRLRHPRRALTRQQSKIIEVSIKIYARVTKKNHEWVGAKCNYQVFLNKVQGEITR